MPHPFQQFQFVILLTPFLALDGCAAHDSKSAIHDLLDSQVDSWNHGDIEGFMQGYWRSDELVFESAGGQTKGWQATLEHYKQRYPTKEKMGRLRFSDLQI